MMTSMKTRLAVAMGLLVICASVLSESLDEPTPIDGPATDEKAEEDPTEEVVVTAPRVERFKIPDVEYVVETYQARREGAQLYNKGKLAESFPYLLAAAERGFKIAQARVGYLYLGGFGTEKDVETGITWLGLASRGVTAPEIRNYMKDIWKTLPEKDTSYLAKRIDEFDAKYGARANRVRCDFSTKTSSRVKELKCRLMDQCLYWETAAVSELHDCPQWFDPCKNPEAGQCGP